MYNTQKRPAHRRAYKKSKSSIHQPPRAYNGWIDKQEPEVQVFIGGVLAVILLAIPMLLAAAMGK